MTRLICNKYNETTGIITFFLARINASQSHSRSPTTQGSVKTSGSLWYSCWWEQRYFNVYGSSTCISKLNYSLVIGHYSYTWAAPLTIWNSTSFKRPKAEIVCCSAIFSWAKWRQKQTGPAGSDEVLLWWPTRVHFRSSSTDHVCHVITSVQRTFCTQQNIG